MSRLGLWSSFLIWSVASLAGVASNECKLSAELLDEIRGYKGFVNEITSVVTTGSYSGVFYDDLAFFTDKFGYRKTGTQVLDVSVKYLSNVLKRKHITTKLENVKVPLWLRGNEIAFYMTSFRKKRLRIKALGGSSSGNVTAPLMIVKDVDELDKRKEEVPGKIVLFNPEFEDYSKTVVNRIEGPAKASHYNAVGALVRSITPFSIGNIHVGVTDFEGMAPIPSAAISLEDADILNRLSKNESIKINLIIKNSAESKEKVSQNLIADIPGNSDPDSYVTLSGHIDSWDVGQGALDDGGGAFLALHSLFLLKHLKIDPPKRTLRAILWTGEEMGLYGAKAYAEAHGHELQNWVAAFESDAGLFEPLGLRTNANEKASCILKEIASLFTEIKATEVERTNETISSDISVFQTFNVPLVEPLMKQNNYFWFHHTDGDSMRVLDPTMMDRHLALATGTAYILANLSKPLPKDDHERRNAALGYKRFTKSHGRNL